MTTITRDRLLTVKQAAFLVGMSPVSMYRRIDSGALPAIRLGSGPKAPIRISSADLAAYLAERYRA
jgi:excisionase family DNA binding protein